MKLSLSFFILLISISLLDLTKAEAQKRNLQSPVPLTINELMTQINGFGESRAPEKLFVQLDKPYYSIGDTIWFKAYLLRAGFLTPSTKSNILYMELVNDSNQVIKQIKLPMASGLSWGNMALGAEDVPAGNYILRAFSNWQRNYNENYMFKKDISISSGLRDPWLVNSKTTEVKDKTTGQPKLNVDLAFLKETDHLALPLQDMEVRVRHGRKTVYRAVSETDVAGLLNLNFAIPPATGETGWSVEVTEKGKTDNPRRLIIPIEPPQSQIDLQFMPESGNIVAGISAHIAFKAINTNGYGTNVSGTIVNSKNQEVTTFASSFKGIGAFDLLPDSAETYTAVLKLDDGKTQLFPLPKVNNLGIVMNIRRRPVNTDTLIVGILGTQDIMNSQTDYYLIGHSQGIVCYASRVQFNGKPIMGKIPTQNFPTGIGSFTLFTADRKPVCERSVFVDHGNKLLITAAPNQKLYHPHDSVSLKFKVTNEHHEPIRINCSVAVTDNSQVKLPDTLNRDNILTRLLLTDDLKGDVESPSWYFNETGVRHRQELDNLLLAQGWVGYDWKDVFSQKPITYDAETDNMVKGRVSNLFNKGKAGALITLFGKNPVILRDTITDAQGQFTFTHLPMSDTTVAYFVQSTKKNGSASNGIELKEFTEPTFTNTERTSMPWYVNSDTAMLKYIHNERRRYQLQEKLTGKVLKTVTIRDKKIIKQSHNLNGPGKADLILDEEEMMKTPKVTLLDVLQKRIAGFGERVPRHSISLQYMLHFQVVKFIIDGIDADFFYTDTNQINGRYHYLKSILEQYNAADIKGIELMSSPSLTGSYNWRFLQKLPLDVTAYAYIEITTRAGKGQFYSPSGNIAVYRPIPFSFPKQFYRPRYTSNRTTVNPDLRSTIHWEPNVITDKDGNATIWFYAADTPGTYTVLVNGTDLNGNLGFKEEKIAITAK